MRSSKNVEGNYFMYFENVIRLDNTIHPSVRQQFTGVFQTSNTWGTGDLELHLSEKGILTGSFTLEDISFGLKGVLGHTGVVFGYLLEPDAAMPVAMLRIKTYSNGLNLEFHVPEFTDIMNESGAEAVLFGRSVKQHPTAMLDEFFVAS